jgi:serine protease Do
VSSAQGRLDGLSLEDLNAINRKRFEVPSDVKQGVVVSGIEAGSAVARSGLRTGDVILEVNRHKITTIAELEREWKRTKGSTLVVVSRAGTTLFVVVRR